MAYAPSAPKMPVYYAVVEHDFIAERQDELAAKRGDAIVVVAQSNREWFVAKPIGKLGRPGLIPVSFVQIHDPVTRQPIDDANALIDRGEIPKVEDWKLSMISYKQNSISLGVLDSPISAPTSPYSPFSAEPNVRVQAPTPTNSGRRSEVTPTANVAESLPEGRLLSANVVSFHYEMDEYWFRVDAIFQPYVRSDLFPAKRLILFRAYNDFYEFQVSLLDAFPREAGRQSPHPRVLPYMPGPSDEVDDALTVSRRKELDKYISDLCGLSKVGYQYILEHSAVRKFLALKPGDVEKDIEPGSQEDTSRQSRHQGHDHELQDKFSQLNVHQNGGAKSDGSEYEDEGYVPSPQQHTAEQNQSSHNYPGRERRSSQDSPPQMYSSSHQRAGSVASFYRATSPYHSRSRSASPQEYDTQWNDSTYQSNHATVQHPHYQHHNFTHGPTASVSSRRSSHTTSSRSRSQSTAPTNLNSPLISSGNPQTAFVKIKIFDKTCEDLIAIRVHPRVTHAELLKKVQDRLENVNILRYRDSNGFNDLASDRDLGDWMESTDKHVLYAE